VGETAVQASNNLMEYGVLGTICVLLIIALGFVYRAKESQTKSHREEMKKLMERHIDKAEQWADNGQKLASNLNQVLESLSRGRS